MGEWGALLNGVYLSGGDGSQLETILATPACSGLDAVAHGCLSLPPDGLGLPELRTEDVTFLQRDGVRHYSDWYEPRIVTLQAAVGGNCRCGGGSGSARADAHAIIQAWKRSCDDVELVIYTDCHGSEDGPAIAGPFGVVGRPRLAQVTWQPGRRQVGNVLLRFDAVDHRLFLLDECGTPGSGEQCVVLTPDFVVTCRTYDRCYEPAGMCYTETAGDGGGGGMQTVAVSGTECVRPVITLTGSLNNPQVENVDTGEVIGYNGTIAAGDAPVIIDAYAGTATQGGQSRTHLLTGTQRWTLAPGEVTLRLLAFSPNDTGTAEVCWRPFTVSA